MNATLAVLGLSGGELVLVLVVILVLFGAKRIPEFAKGLGKGINEFKKASREVTDEIERAVDEPPPAPPTKAPHPDENEEEGGGPVKTFLEHLEDLRWMLIKSGTALLIGMIVCLYATEKVVSILKLHLKR